MKQPKIYRQKTAAVIAKTVAKVAACVILAACILFVSLFFYMKRFAVYDENGEISDITVSYSESYAHQMLRYSSEYATLI